MLLCSVTVYIYIYLTKVKRESVQIYTSLHPYFFLIALYYLEGGRECIYKVQKSKVIIFSGYHS